MGKLLKERYFEWMCDLVYDSRSPKKYDLLFRCLDSIPFTYILEMDENRAQDGLDLRYRFGYECDVDGNDIYEYLDREPCSVLEMIVALSFRIEEDIMGNESVGNRTNKWFWTMIENLGLASMSNDNFDEYYTKRVINKFLDRNYKRNGEGGLVTLHNCSRDLREVEIWDQVMLYLNGFFENFDEKG